MTTTTALDSIVDGVVDHLEDDRTAVAVPPPYVAAIPADEIFADPAYQRPLDDYRVQRMVEKFDPALLGILDVSLRADGRYAVIDGQHRWALAKEVHGKTATLVSNVHRGLTVAQEAALFFDIDRTRRNLTGWDRWWARRGSGETTVIDIERVVESHGLKVSAATRDGILRATKACEDVVALGGLSLLDDALRVMIAGWGTAADALDGALLLGVAMVLHHYDLETEVSIDRLITAMQGIAPRQVKARAAQLREAHKGLIARLVAAVLVDRYNAQPGRRVEEFFVRLPAQSKSKPKRGAAARQDDAIRTWARREGMLPENKHRLNQPIREAFAAAHPSGADQ